MSWHSNLSRLRTLKQPNYWVCLQDIQQLRDIQKGIPVPLFSSLPKPYLMLQVLSVTWFTVWVVCFLLWVSQFLWWLLIQYSDDSSPTQALYHWLTGSLWKSSTEVSLIALIRLPSQGIRTTFSLIFLRLVSWYRFGCLKLNWLIWSTSWQVCCAHLLCWRPKSGFLYTKTSAVCLNILTLGWPLFTTRVSQSRFVSQDQFSAWHRLQTHLEALYWKRMLVNNLSS
jgi:hypothetical protein